MPPRRPPSDLYRVAWVFYLVMALSGAAWLILAESRAEICGDKGLCLALFLDSGTWPIDLAIGLGVGLSILALWEVARRYLPIAAAMEVRLAELVGSLHRDEAIALALISGFSEELFFRGAIQGSLGWPLATLIFALVHTGPGKALRFWTLYAGIAGLLLAGLMVWTGNLLAPIVTHALVNGFGLWRLRSKPGSSDAPNDADRPPKTPAPLLDSDDGSTGTSHRINGPRNQFAAAFRIRKKLRRPTEKGDSWRPTVAPF